MVAKKTPAKKTSAKKPASKVAHKKTSAKKSTKMQSFKVYRDTQSFGTFRITRQTVYWTILLAFIIVTQLWILKIQLDIAELTNSLLSQ